MTDTPKILRDMTDAEIGALVRARNEGKRIEYYNDAIHEWIYEPPQWSGFRAYRIAPPKLLPLEAGKVYRTAAQDDRLCIAVIDGNAWVRTAWNTRAVAHVYSAQTGKAFCLNPGYHVIGLSDNQEPSQ